MDSLFPKIKLLHPEDPDDEIHQGISLMRTQFPEASDEDLLQKAEQTAQPSPMQLNSPTDAPAERSVAGITDTFSPEARESAQMKADKVKTSGRRQIGDALTVFAEGFKKTPDLAGAMQNNRAEKAAIDDKYVGAFDKAKQNAVADYSLNKKIKADETATALESVKKDPKSAYSVNKRLIAQKYDSKNKDKYKDMSGAEIDELLPDLKDIRTLDDKKLAHSEDVASKNALLAEKKNKEENKPSEATKAVDKNFGKEYADYVAGGGYATVKKNLDQLRDAAGKLGKNGPNVSGGLLGLVPKGARDVIAPKGAAVQDAIEQTILTTLRQTLGAQFTENEGKKVLAYAFNPRQSEEENLVRVNRLIDQLENQAKAKADAAAYYEQNGTLKGFQGPKFASRAEDLFGESEKSKSSVTESDVDNMSLEELQAAGLI